MISQELIRKELAKVGKKFSEQEIVELAKTHQSKMKEEKCPLCQTKFSKEDIQANKYAVELSCPSTEPHYFHPDCLKLQREEKTNPLLFAKVKKLEEEITEIKRMLRK